MTTRFLESLAFSALLCTPASALTDPLLGRFVEWSAISPDSTGNFTKALAGDLYAMGNPHVLLLRDDRLYFAWSPLHHASAGLQATGINDFCIVPGAGLSGSDGYATAGTAGIHVRPYAGAFQGNPTWFDSSPAVAGATKIGCGDLDGDGTVDLAVVLANGVDVRVYHGNPGGGFTLSAARLVIGQPVRDIWIVRWGVSLVPRMIVHTAGALSVFTNILTADGILRTNLPGPPVDAANVFTLASGEQGLFWATSMPNPPATGAQRIFSYRQSGAIDYGLLGPFEAEPAVHPGVSALAMRDVSGDAYPELFLSCTATPLELYAHNYGSPVSGPLVFDLSGQGLQSRIVSYSSQANPSNRAWPVLADFDGDKQTDLFVGVPGPFAGQTGVTALPGPLEQGATVSSSWPGLPITSAWYTAVDSPPPPASFPVQNRLRLQLQDVWTTHAAATHLRVVMWKWPYPCGTPPCSEPSLPLEPVSFRNFYFPLTNGALPSPMRIDLAEPGGPAAPGALGGEAPLDHAVFCIELSLVTATIQNGTARVTQAWTTYPYGFAKQAASAASPNWPIARMSALPQADTAHQTVVTMYNGIPGIAAAPNIGIIIPLPRSPNFPPNSSPALSTAVVRAWAP
jgi:hypothetical protein